MKRMCHNPSSRLPRFARVVFAAVVLFIAFSPRGYAQTTPQTERGLALTPKAFRAAAAKVAPVVVTIDTVGGINIASGGERAQKEIGGIANPGEGPTTGVLISDDGYIITSTYNFITKPRIITVTLADGSQHVAELLGRDDMRKLTLLKIEDVKDLPTPTFVEPSKVRVGQWAVSVGVGYGGDEAAVSSGIVSALNRVGGMAIQTDANLSPANYGGPLVDIRGRVIGICVPLNPKAAGQGAGSEWYDSGIGFAVTLDGIEHLIDRMKKGEHLKRGLMGFIPAKQPAKGGGVKIQKVIDKTPAKKAGLLDGDIIIAMNDQPIADANAMAHVLARYAAGDEIVVTYRRGDDEPQQLTMKLETGPFKQLRRRPDNIPTIIKPNPKPDAKPDAKPDTPDENAAKPDEGDADDTPDTPDADEQNHDAPVPSGEVTPADKKGDQPAQPQPDDDADPEDDGQV